MKILVADDVSESGLKPLREAAFTVEKRTGLPKDELIKALQGCEGLDRSQRNESYFRHS